MLHLGCDVLLGDVRRLIGSEMALVQPLGVAVAPGEAVTPNRHSVGHGETDDFVSLGEIKLSGLACTTHHFIESSGSTMLNSCERVAE